MPNDTCTPGDRATSAAVTSEWTADIPPDDAWQIGKLLQAVAGGAATDSSRPILEHVRLTFASDRLRMESADGFTAMIVDQAMPDSDDGSDGPMVYLHRKEAVHLGRALVRHPKTKGNATLRATPTEHGVDVTATTQHKGQQQETVAQGRTEADWRFPDIEQLMPEPDAATVASGAINPLFMQRVSAVALAIDGGPQGWARRSAHAPLRLQSVSATGPWLFRAWGPTALARMAVMPMHADALMPAPPSLAPNGDAGASK